MARRTAVVLARDLTGVWFQNMSGTSDFKFLLRPIFCSVYSSQEVSLGLYSIPCRALPVDLIVRLISYLMLISFKYPFHCA
jgi:hypothetical protein